MKVLNLYAGIGGNRKLWQNVEVTAVEVDSDIAKIYQDFFPNDKVVVGDAHHFLPEHCNDYDFVWASPPCPTHSQYRQNVGVIAKGFKPLYPDMRLYQEIIFLQYNFKGKWVVENTVSYYDPLIKPQKVGAHYFWSNFYISPKEFEKRGIRDATNADLEKTRFDLSAYTGIEKRTVLRNCVNSELGLHIFDCAFKKEVPQLLLFNMSEIEKAKP
jgi:DNA (cytosine-5)-methyltransferase 1